ncbi:hypothetical protein HYDPIDRAFT_32946 [Hydnomerulius pinastri MD-312]|uniref:Uncharacterized protein n=1 Tax=Hydnomerulius pinastri MD-312 TaxID=994086 RepID=A0A0C9VPY0_9AGAM|nr:hypothetical protein HYDPIDRAFT_32946 [Hydnomerulius pinastri MD-312]
MAHPLASLFSVLVTLQFGSSAYGRYVATKRDVPEIDGSQGGFIGLVVALSILIVVCCLAVFFLLRNHEPTEQDRANRRERYRRHREEQDVGSSVPPASTFGSLGEKFKRIWSKNSSSGRRGGRGWIQAGSGDEWEFDSDRGNPELAGGRAEGGQMQQFPRRDVEDHARIIESPLSESGSGFIPVHYTDPFSKESPTSHISPMQMSPERSQSPLSLGSPREEASAEDDVDAPPPDHRHLSSLSTTSVWTSAGSKFIEDI